MFKKSQSVIVMFAATVADVIWPVDDPVFVVENEQGARFKVLASHMVDAAGREEIAATDEAADQFTGRDKFGMNEAELEAAKSAAGEV